MPKSIAPEIEVRWARRTGWAATFSAKPRALSGPSRTRPGHDHPLVPGAGPFEVDDRDLAEHAAPDRVVDLRGAEGLGEAFPLQRELVHVHRVGDVDRDHEGEVDLGVGAGRRSGRDGEQRARG